MKIVADDTTHAKPTTQEVIYFILRLLAAGTFISLALLAPNAIGPVMNLLRQQKIHPRKAKAVVHYLKRHNVVIVREDGDQTVVEIAEKGRKKLAKYNFEKLRIAKPKRWDGKWRLVAFDIPEKKKAARDALRSKLRELGFCKIQQSLWVHPFECRNEVNFVSEVFQISPYLWLIEASDIDHAQFLEKKYNLNG